MVMSVVVISGCTGQTDDEQLSIMGVQENGSEELLHEQVMPIGEQVLPIEDDRENIVVEDEMATGHTGSVETVENEEKNVAVESDKDEDDTMKADAAECIASGKIYSAMMGECFENNTAPSDSDKKLEINDDDSDISRAAKECINDGGLFNSQLQECFK